MTRFFAMVLLLGCSSGGGGGGGDDDDDSSGPCAPDDVQGCYAGPDETIDIGVCAGGEQVCDADGAWGACAGEVLPGEEICGNGVDEDCDGVPDGDCPCAPTEPVVARGSAQGHHELVATGDVWGLFTRDDPSLYATILDRDGLVVAGPRQVASGEQPRGHDATATDDGFAIVWHDDPFPDSFVRFARVGPDAEVVGDVVDVASVAGGSIEPAVAWSGDGVGVAWNDRVLPDDDVEVFFRAFDATGRPTTDAVRLTASEGASWNVEIAWNGTGYGIEWQDGRGSGFASWFAVVDAAGTMIVAEHSIPPGANGVLHHELAASGDRFAVASGVLGAITLTVLDASGVSADGRMTVGACDGSSASVGLDAAGSGWAVAWESVYGSVGDVSLARTDASGAVQGDVVHVGAGGYPSVAFSAGRIGVAWAGENTSPSLREVWFQAFCP